MTQPDSISEVGIQQVDESVCLIGLGYVGLPLAVAFDDQGYDVLGFDVDDGRVDTLQSAVDPTETVGDDAVSNCDVEFTADSSSIGRADKVIIAVPTPVTEDQRPDLSSILAAAETVGTNMSQDTTVVLESTVYPGLTAEELVPTLERVSGFTAGEEFHVGYSPERATIGDTDHGLNQVIKVVSAFEEDVLEDLATFYGSIVDAGVFKAPSVEAAEAAKVIENVQRDVNIALMNELAMAFDHLDIETQDVIETAATKWNFHEYAPGLVGGHCIPVDPYYFLDRAKREGFTPELIETGRKVNASMPDHVLRLVSDAFDEAGKDLSSSRVLVLGLSYKPDVPDVRSRAIADTVAQLKRATADVVGHDPHVPERVIEDRFGIDVTRYPTFQEFDGVVVLTPHSLFETLDPGDLAFRMPENPVLVDLQGLFDRDEVEGLPFSYRTL